MTNKITITPKSNLLKIDFKELWSFHELFYIFSWRDIKVRYKQTLLGVAWAIFQPLISMVIFSFFFGQLAKIPSGNLPYMVFVYTGLVVWNFFSSALSRASSSLVENEELIKKIYFPRLIIPTSAVTTCFLDLAITSLIFIPLLVYFRVAPHPLLILLLPLLLLIVFLTATGLGLFLAALNVKYRDVRYILPFFIQLMMFLTPVIYPTTIIADRHKWILAVNPLTAVIEVIRNLLGGKVIFDYPSLALSFLISVTVCLFGVYYFKRTERFFADII